MALPRFVAITSDYSDKKYMRYTREDHVAEVHGFLKLSGEEVLNSLSKYEVKMADCGNGLVHIRCCYNNKYWRKSSENGSWIVAGANEPEEDHTKWSCTMFKPILVGNDPLSFRFRHIQLEHYVSLMCSKEVVSPYDFCIQAKSADEGTHDIFKIIDWETLVILPRHVAFKGDNHLYLKAFCTVQKDPFLQFSASEIGDPYVGDEIFPNNNGSIRIKNNYFNKFWRRDHHDWINTDADESASINNHETIFWPVKVENNVIALRNDGNTLYCKRLTDLGQTSCLSASDYRISTYSQMEVEEKVPSSRSIYNVTYHLMDDRIYDETVLVVASADVVNTTKETKQMDVKLSYKDVLSWSWSSSVSLTSSWLGYKSKVTAGIPKIAEAKAEIIDGNFSADYEWGKTEEKETTVEVTYHATVLSRTKVTVKLMANKGSCDIPFSYTRHDILLDGKSTTYDMDDGISTCSNCYNFYYETSEEPIKLMNEMHEKF